jgi:hypothetical protein
MATEIWRKTWNLDVPAMLGFEQMPSIEQM